MLRWDLTMFLLAPFTQALSGLLLAGGILANALQGDGNALLLAACGLGLYSVGGMALGVALCLLGGYELQRMTKAILLFPVFMASWLPLQVASLFRDTKTWRPVAHQGQRAAHSAGAGR